MTIAANKRQDIELVAAIGLGYRCKVLKTWHNHPPEPLPLELLLLLPLEDLPDLPLFLNTVE
jgi:hypothetical protein